MRRTLLGIGVSIIGLAVATASAAAPRYLFAQANASVPAEVHIKHVGEPVKDEYLVFLVEGDKHEVPGIAQGLAHAHQGNLIRVWNDGVQGFWINMNAARAEAMLHDPHIRSIEENAVLHESGTEIVGGSGDRLNDPFWHLDRIDQRSPNLDGKFQYCNGATQVYAYIFDRGVRAADPQLSGRVIAGVNKSPADDPGTNILDTDPPPYPDGPSFNETNPCGMHNLTGAGHGTSVATLLAGSDVGVSKKTIVVPLRLSNCQNSSNPAKPGDEPGSDLPSSASWIDAFDWLFDESKNPLWDSTNQRSRVPAVANFSTYIASVPIATGEFEVERYVQKLIAGGVVVVASANNQFKAGESLSQVPTRLSYSNPNPSLFDRPERLICVGGTLLTMPHNGIDKRWVCGTGDSTTGDPACSSDNGSNFGAGVDLWAPAQGIQSGHIAPLSPSPDDPWTPGTQQYRRPYYKPPNDRASKIASFPPPTYERNGTSFAAPIVAGAAARLLSEDPSLFNDPSATASIVWSRLSASATRLNATADLGTGSTNLFLYIGGVNFKTQPQSQTVSAGGTATLTAEAVGSGVSYRLYAGHTGDMDGSSLVRDWQTSSTFGSLPSMTKTYWIQAKRACPDPGDGSAVIGDSVEATIMQAPILTATAPDSTHVTVSWTPDAGTGTTFDVFRASAGSAFNFAQPINAIPLTTTQLTDTNVQHDHAYLYRVRATNGTSSAMSVLPDYATTTDFTDPDLIVSPRVKAAHIRELRLAVNLVAGAMGLSDRYSPSDLSSPPIGQVVMSFDFVNVMAKLNEARTAYGMPPLSFASTPPPGGPILKSHLITLRNAVD